LIELVIDVELHSIEFLAIILTCQSIADYGNISYQFLVFTYFGLTFNNAKVAKSINSTSCTGRLWGMNEINFGRAEILEG
jgi:hypothetical protein